MLLTDESGLPSIRGGIFVPTMGALHAGHAVLIRRAFAARAARAVRAARLPLVVSIFVNPTQFNDPADLARYPRTLERDLAMCRDAGADAVFAPGPEVVYPAGAPVPVPELPAVATEPKLEDAHRPGHFSGVCQVVARLFDLVQPRAAMFGEKDWQQLQVVRAMTRRLPGNIEIVGVPTVREPDGLAMSSRNAFLSGEDRVRATSLSRALRAAAGCAAINDAEAAMRRVFEEAGVKIEYAVVRDSETLMPVGAGVGAERPKRALIAARVGTVRLIDNDAWGGGVG